MFRTMIALFLLLVAGYFFPPPALGFSPPAAETSQTLTFNPTHDAYVKGDDADTNFGSNTSLQLDDSPDKDSFLRFEVSGVRGKVTAATLRLYPNSTLSAGFSVNLPTTSGTSGGGQWVGHWTESVVTYNLAPVIGPQIATSGAVTSGTWVEIDVKNWVAGNGYVVFALEALSTQNLSLSSKEGSNDPELVVVYDKPPTHTFNPSQDSYVDSANPSTNYGTDVNLRTDASDDPLDNVQYIFLRFNVTGLASSRDVESATLRLYPETGSTTTTVEVRKTSGSWTEGGVTFDDSPGIGAVIDSVPNVTAATWVEFDVLSQVSGEGNVDFVITSLLAQSTKAIRWESDESSGSNEPELVIEMNFENVVVATAGDLVCESTTTQTNQACHDQDTVDAIRSSNSFSGVDFFLALGDLQYEDGEGSEFNSEYDASYGAIKSITKPVPGNHDYHTADAGGYFAYFGTSGSQTSAPGVNGTNEEGFYTEVIGDWRLYALNSVCPADATCSEGGEQNNWLETELSNNTEECIVAIGHHPRFTSGRHQHDNTSQIAALWTDLVASEADLMLSGHDHYYEQTLKIDDSGVYSATGMREFVVGTGGRSLPSLRTSGEEIDNPQSYTVIRDEKDFGYLELKLFDGWYEWNFYSNPDGFDDDFVDSGSGWCNS